ncbi:hypothetical protein [Viridibacterium curvum]|uniref:Uncharacterized protein n=1 Tax=Viridibacterium curvum TaxID=1101404 RepID=A0ABP9R668_9RHOO
MELLEEATTLLTEELLWLLALAEEAALEDEDRTALLATLDAALEALLEDTLDEELDEALAVGAYEHHAEVPKLLLGKALPVHAKLPVLVAYTNVPDFPSATERVPLMVQVAPVFCAHFV